MYKKMYLFLQSSIGKPGRLQYLLHYYIGHSLHIVFLPGHCVVERDVKEAEEKDKNAKFFFWPKSHQVSRASVAGLFFRPT